jgi:hypothetical protein
LGDQIEGDGMGKSTSTHVKIRNANTILVGKLEREDSAWETEAYIRG